jgi:ABC-2 type transport system permease protein
MLRGLWKLTWLEMKIFVREPLGLIGTVGMPVLVFVVLGRMFGRRPNSTAVTALVTVDLPILASILMALSAVLSLVTIVSIYREGGILKRLRATPLRPHTILTAHVIARLAFTAVTLALMVLVGRRYYPAGIDGPVVSFGLALLFSTLSIVSMGFLIASMVPTARFAQPIGTLILYPMLGLTYAVSLLRGIWRGEGWTAHAGDVAGLALVFLICTAISAKAFRWE